MSDKSKTNMDTLIRMNCKKPREEQNTQQELNIIPEGCHQLAKEHPTAAQQPDQQAIQGPAVSLWGGTNNDQPVLWSRSRPEPDFKARAGAGEKSPDPALGCCRLA